MKRPGRRPGRKLASATSSCASLSLSALRSLPLGAPTPPASLPWAPFTVSVDCPRGSPSGKVVTSQLHGAGEWLGTGPPNTALNRGDQKPVQQSCDILAWRAVAIDGTVLHRNRLAQGHRLRDKLRKAGLSRASSSPAATSRARCWTAAEPRPGGGWAAARTPSRGARAGGAGGSWPRPARQ